MRRLKDVLLWTWSLVPAWWQGHPACVKSLQWLLFTLIGGLLPTWGAIVLFLLFSQALSFALFVSNGEFALYAALLVAPMFYTLTLERPPKGFPFRGWFAAAGLLLLLFSVLVFAGTLLSSKGALQAGFPLNQSFLTWSSILSYVVSVAVVFAVTLLDLSMPAQDILQLRSKEEQALAEGLRKERGE